MRALPILLALLVALMPLGAAQSGDGSSDSDSDSKSESHSSSSSPQPASDCKRDGENQPANSTECREQFERYCREHPGDSRCRAMHPARDANATQQGNDSHDADANNSKAEPGARWCKENGFTPAQAQACRSILEEFGDDFDGGRQVTFQVDADNFTLLNVRIGRFLALQSIQLHADSDNVSVERLGRQLRIGDNDTALVLNDNPTGLIRFKGTDGRAVMTFPVGIEVQAHPQGFRVHYPSGPTGLLLAEDAVWLNNNTIVISTFGAFHIPAQSDDSENVRKNTDADEKVQQAVERRQVGAEVSLKAPTVAAGRIAVSPGAEDSDHIQVLAYDDVQVKVDAASLGNRDTPIRIEVSSELDSGRTIVVKVDPALLGSERPEDLILRYFDLYPQADGSVLETEVVFRQASSLIDVLDASDDDGQPEYWVVRDADGVQVLFSVPHWSVHAMTISSVAAFVSQPNVVAGIVIGTIISVMAATGLLWPRRRDEDDEF